MDKERGKIAPCLSYHSASVEISCVLTDQKASAVDCIGNETNSELRSCTMGFHQIIDVYSNNVTINRECLPNDVFAGVGSRAWNPKERNTSSQTTINQGETRHQPRLEYYNATEKLTQYAVDHIV